MRYVVKQRAHSPAEGYTITTEHGDAMYLVKAVPLTFGLSFEMCDLSDQPVASIHQRLAPVEPNYSIMRNGVDLGEVHTDPRAISYLRLNLGGVETGLVLKVDQSENSLTMTFEGTLVARVEKELSLVANSYVVDVLGGFDVPTALSLVIVFDAVTRAEQH